jgi:hypothetical protein
MDREDGKSAGQENGAGKGKGMSWSSSLRRGADRSSIILYVCGVQKVPERPHPVKAVHWSVPLELGGCAAPP